MPAKKHRLKTRRAERRRADGSWMNHNFGAPGDESAVAHRHAGRYLTVCGAQVLAASLTASQRSQCPACTRGAQ
jgi:hypothetical protein